MPATVLVYANTSTNPGISWVRGQIVTQSNTGEYFPVGSGEGNTGRFYQFKITDKTPASVDKKFFSSWTRDINFEIVSGPDPQGFRRIKMTNLNLNLSETIGFWTQEQADTIVTNWNDKYPSTNLVTVGLDNKDLIQEGTFTTQQAAEFQEVVFATGETNLDAQRIWFVTETGMQWFESRPVFGIGEGTAVQFGDIVEDGLLT